MNLQINSLLQGAIQNFKINNFLEAKVLLSKVLDTEPQNFDALYIMGVIFGKDNNHIEALKFFKKAQKIRSNNNLINFNLAKAFSEIGNDLEAIKYYKIAIRLDKNHLGSWLNFGKSLYELKRYKEALFHYDQAIKLKPDFVEAHNNKAVALNNLKHYDDALFHYDQAIKLDPNYYKAHNNKGTTFNELKRYDDALFHYDQAIKLKPDFVDAYFNKALTKLTLGDFEEGWKLHQYRWKIGSQQYRHSNSRLLEDISNVKNKKVLVWHEQGLGDTVMFSRYVPKLVDLGAIVVFEVQEDLKLFFKNQFNCEINNEVSAKEFFDFQVPLLDLPKLFNTSTKTIPYNRPYLSVQDKKKEWKEKLQLSKNRLNVGISVSGQPNHKRNSIRSLSLKTMEPILQEANFFLIQKELNDEDKKFLNNHKKINFLGDEINNFLDTAAIVSNMDLIISIDTSLIHLAGAIGKKSFLMLSYSADWRWLLDQNKTPWYENIKIFRQDSIGNWDFVINQIQDEFNKSKINI